MKIIDLIFSRGGYILPASIDGKPKFKDIPENRITDREKLLHYYNKRTERRKYDYNN
jgi:hypothetical protein